MNSAGTLVRGQGVDSVTNLAGAGAYRVDFNQAVDQCAWIVAVGQTGSGTPSFLGIGAVGADPAGTDRLLITTYNGSVTAHGRALPRDGPLLICS